MLGDIKPLLSKSACTIQSSEIRKILELTRSRELISFAGGLPSPAIFPVDEIAECTAAILSGRGRLALQYGPTRGDPEYLAEVGSLTDQELALGGEANPKYGPSNLIATSGSQQALDLVGKLLLNPGDSIVVGLPSYIGALQAFSSLGAKFHGVPVDADGISTDGVAKLLLHLRERGQSPKLIYTVPDFQNPSGVCLSLPRRQRLIELAEEYGCLIVEDSPYRRLRFAGETIPSIISLDSNQRTICLQTMSKIMAPGLRLGWIIGRAELIEKLVLLKQATDLCTSSFNQAVAAEFCRRGYLFPHIQRTISVYREKRNHMLQALEQHMPGDGSVTWTRPDGGMFLWLTLPERMDANQLLLRAIDRGVAFVMGTAFYADGSGKNTLRVNFSYPEIDQIESGISRLASLIVSSP